MQDRYVGDVGDFGKLSLLRRLVSSPRQPLSLGVHWCMFPDESHNADGRHIAYLEDVAFRKLDPVVHATLHELVSQKRRSVAELAKSAIFEPGSRHFLSRLPMRDRAAERHEERRLWARAALDALRGCDLVFLDPDNGIEAASVPPTSPKAGKYVFWPEIEAFWQAGHSLVVYHHANRTAPVQQQVDHLRAKFHARLGVSASIHPLVYRRGSCRTFWVIAQAKHAPLVHAQVQTLLTGGWEKHFRMG